MQASNCSALGLLESGVAGSTWSRVFGSLELQGFGL